jgi:hypothetical protein
VKPTRESSGYSQWGRLDELLDLGLQLKSLPRLITTQQGGAKISILLSLLLQAMHVLLDPDQLADEVVNVIQGVENVYEFPGLVMEVFRMSGIEVSEGEEELG